MGSSSNQPADDPPVNPSDSPLFNKPLPVVHETDIHPGTPYRSASGVTYTGKSRSVSFRDTPAYSTIRGFLYRTDQSIKRDTQAESADDLLSRAAGIIDSTPLSEEHGRYANPAMKSVISSIACLTDDWYFQESFGNPTRMDYGTGHELNFLCYLYCRHCRGEVGLNEVLPIMGIYFRIIRKYIKKYNIEAAGARGCWSMDDYLLLPFVFGSAENFDDPRTIEYIFTGVFREAWEEGRPTGMLRSICALGWHEINVGVLRMYEEEVLGKKVVTQHFIYSDCLPSGE